MFIEKGKIAIHISDEEKHKSLTKYLGYIEIFRRNLWTLVKGSGAGTGKHGTELEKEGMILQVIQDVAFRVIFPGYFTHILEYSEDSAYAICSKYHRDYVTKYIKEKREKSIIKNEHKHLEHSKGE